MFFGRDTGVEQSSTKCTVPAQIFVGPLLRTLMIGKLRVLTYFWGYLKRGSSLFQTLYTPIYTHTEKEFSITISPLWFFSQGNKKVCLCDRIRASPVCKPYFWTTEPSYYRTVTGGVRVKYFSPTCKKSWSKIRWLVYLPILSDFKGTAPQNCIRLGV